MNENMKFKGGPDDKTYRRKVMDLCEGQNKFIKVNSAFRDALRKKVGMYIDLHRKDEEEFKQALKKEEKPKEPK